MARILRLIFGYLVIRIRGSAKERFLNLCIAKGMEGFSASCEEDSIVATIRLKDFYQLRPFVRKTKVKVVILKRIGLPFLIPKLKKRPFFILGALLALIVWIFMGSFLGKIEIMGNVKITDDQIMDFLRERKVNVGMPLSRIDIEALEKDLRKCFAEVTWVSMTIEGTNMTVSVKEDDCPNYDAQTEDHVGMDLISPWKGTVVSMIVRSGVPKVKTGEEVEKEQILISGKLPIYQEDGTVEEWIDVDVDGDVVIEYVRQYEDGISYFHEESMESGRKNNDYMIRLGGGYWKLFGKKDYFTQYLVESDVTPWIIKRISERLRINISFSKIERREYHRILKKYSGEEAELALNEKLLHFLETLEEKGVQIIEKNVKIENEGDFGLMNGELLLREKASLYRRTEENIDGKDD